MIGRATKVDLPFFMCRNRGNGVSSVTVATRSGIVLDTEGGCPDKVVLLPVASCYALARIVLSLFVMA